VDNLRFQNRLLQWYGENKRVLSWRSTRSAYRIWISEIMLQQTRVAVVVDRYRDFLRRFPTISSLAAARTSDVLAAWSGLGYYRRARAAHQTAKRIVREHAGRFPRQREQLRQLPGIGEYTSAAIASIAFGAPHAVVDGNVRRVLERLSGRALSPRGHAALAQELLSLSNPGDFNQAMMELGATLCLPGEPKCADCPVRKFCGTRGRHASVPKGPRQNKREITCALERRDGSVLLVQRSASEQLMPDMWELPQVASGASDIQLFSVRHSITTTDYRVRVVSGNGREGTWTCRERLTKLALTGLTKKILRRAGIIKSSK